MGYYDAEILIQDVNMENANIYQSGWVYVTAPKDKKAPLYFAALLYRRERGARHQVHESCSDTSGT